MARLGPVVVVPPLVTSGERYHKRPHLLEFISNIFIALLNTLNIVRILI